MLCVYAFCHIQLFPANNKSISPQIYTWKFMCETAYVSHTCQHGSNLWIGLGKEWRDNKGIFGEP